MTQTFVNQTKTSTLVGCSRQNLNKMWKKEKEYPGTYTFFSTTGKINIADSHFIELYGDHRKEYEKILKEENKPKPPPVKKSKPKSKPEPETKPKKKRGRPPGKKPAVKKVSTKTKPPVKKTKPDPPPKKRTEKQLEQDKVQQEKEEEKSNAAKDPELLALTKKAQKADKIEKINKAHKSEIELKKARADLVEIESLAETCFGYLSSLNQNMMEMPTSFIDEFDAATKTKRTRSERIDILRTPICYVIKETKEHIEKEIEKARRTARAYEKKNNIQTPVL